MAWLVFAVCCTFVGWPLVKGLAVKTGSAYSDVTVAIHKDVKESGQLLEDIMVQFTKASRVLYDGTDGWAYFKDIVIAVPSTWEKSPSNTNVFKDPFPQAEFRIENGHGDYGDVPYTLQPGECGEPGEYVHLTPTFMTMREDLATDKYGPRDRIIAHEWSHLRYGIFDEYGTPGDPTYPLFYFNKGLVYPNLCSKDIKGWIQSEQGSICDVYDDEFSKDCLFVPDLNDAVTRTSLMSLHYLPNVNRFCTKDGSSAHNSHAPSKQNLLCQRRSAWEVISKHPDFSLQKNTGEPFSPPNFRVVRVESFPPRYIFVLDISSSMTGRPVELMKQSCNWFVKELVQDDSYVGVVLFNGEARELQPMVRVDTGTRRSISANLQSIAAGGYTSIGAGVRLGLQVLKRSGVPTEDALLFLLSDGQENRSPMIADVMNEVKASKVKVFSLAFGQQASLNMESLVTATGGKAVFLPDINSQSTADLDQLFIAATTVQGDVDVQFVQLLNKPFHLTEAVTQTEVRLDDELGKNVVFTLAGQVAQVDMELLSPGGTQYLQSDPAFSRDAARLQYKLSTAQSGLWKVTLRKRAAGVVTVDLGLVSEPRAPGSPVIRVHSWINGEEIAANKGAKVFARVTKGEDVVIRAEVKGLVVSDTGRRIEIRLRDNGAGADTTADDGIYTAFFSNFTAGEKRYTVTAEVTNRGQAFIKAVRNSPSPILLRRELRVPPNAPARNTFELKEFQVLNEDPEPNKSLGEPAADFDRTVTGGAFIVKDFVANQVDRIKPSAVNDLIVKETGETKDNKKFVTLAWTAPGDNMDSGTPAKLEVRISLNGDEFAKDFASGFLLDESHVISGSLAPIPGGERQEVKLAIPKELLDQTVPRKPFDVYLAVKATDKAGNVGELGKIAAGNFGYEIPICVQPTGQFPRARHCDQFYHCSNGIPYIKSCPAGLHYSSHQLRCEWPCAAKCDSKISCAPGV